jgi:hypothetical protein
MKGDIVIWQKNILLILAEDEQLSSTFEEIILINVLDLVNERLLDCVRYHYQHLSGKLNWLMDPKNDIFVMGPKGENNRQAVVKLKCSYSISHKDIYKSLNISTLSLSCMFSRLPTQLHYDAISVVNYLANKFFSFFLATASTISPPKGNCGKNQSLFLECNFLGKSKGLVGI